MFTKTLMSALVVLMMTFTSCNEDQEGTSFNGEGKDYVSFLSPAVSGEITADMNGVLKVYVTRTDKSLEGTVADVVIASGSSDLFTLASNQVTFKKGEGSAFAEVRFNYDDLEFGTEYTIKLQLANENLSPSATEECAIKTKLKLTWKSIGTGTWTTQFFGDTFDVEFEEAMEAPGELYRTVDMITDGFPIEIHVDKTNGKASIQMQNTGFDANGILYYNATGTYNNGLIVFPKANANNPTNYYYIKSGTSYSPAYYLTESFQLPEGH